MFYKNRYRKAKNEIEDLNANNLHLTDLYQRILSENHEHLKTIKGLKELIIKNKTKTKQNENK
jgi:hypothetical protein|tara:strand:- start:3475 stop:3663 length:189 start_codon:yes stop_codon:yes gene_type:complete